MKVYIFIYNVVPVKSELSELLYEENAKFVLAGSDFCIQRLSEKNKDFFHDIHQIDRSFHQIDFHHLESIVSTYLETVSAENIVLLTNEDSTQVACAQLREKYAIPGVSEFDVLPFVNKEVSKNRLDGKIRTPKFLLVDKQRYLDDAAAYQQYLVETIGFPMFIKPIDLVSSIGTHYIPDVESLERALASVSNAPWEFEVDEFIQGDLYHCDFIVQDNEIVFFMAGKYAHGLAEFSKGKPMGSIPVGDDLLLDALKQFSQEALVQLGTFSSAFHIEIFQEHGTGELVFLEAAARTPGALVPEMYERIHNRHLEHMHYQAQIGLEKLAHEPEITHSAGWITYPQVFGNLEDIISPDLNVGHHFMTFVAPGEQLKNAESLLDSACSVVFWDQCHTQIEEAFEALKSHRPLVVNAD